MTGRWMKFHPFKWSLQERLPVILEGFWRVMLLRLMLVMLLEANNPWPFASAAMASDSLLQQHHHPVRTDSVSAYKDKDMCVFLESRTEVIKHSVGTPTE
ncbi:hypothetical protein FALCPG4_009402 [Fusarium falciforme]